MMLTQLAAVARRTGYPVVEVSGWKTRGRPGGMRGVRTVTCHHTANGGAKGNYPSLRVVRDGRAGLPGPLAHYGIGRDGTIYVIAAGKCNHAGASRSVDYTNSYAIGIEAEAIGTPGAKGDWPAKQMDSYARLCAALVDEFDLAVANVRGHKETCAPAGRKIDPSFPMPTFRDRTAAVNLKTQPAQEVELSFKDKHKLTDADVAAFGRPTLKKGQEKSFGELIRFPPATERVRRELTAQIGALTKLVAGLADAIKDGGSLTADQAEQAATVGARAALAELADALDGPDQ